MKEYKFRAWDKNNNKFIAMSELIFNYKQEVVSTRLCWNRDIQSIKSAFGADMNIVLLQYTGLKDKNEVEIYFESDFVKFSYIDSCGDEQEEFGVVILDLKYMLSICVKTNSGKILNIVQADLCNIEIIGNIYENPELMEKV